ncbi:MAG: YlmC/YmxH family sporulation protein [Oscillospiraceae bacterium]|nr:YlmC/YmxH family sporulation protein [Oscillospiraceae bacterium]
MSCCVADLCQKEVINIADGVRIGRVCDVEVDTSTGRVLALIIYGRQRLVGVRDEDIRICWEEIDVIGDDTILVRAPDCRVRHNPKKNVFSNFFN